MVNTRDIKAKLMEIHQNPLTAYSTLQLQEELSKRRRSHVMLRLRVKRQLHKHRKRYYKR